MALNLKEQKKNTSVMRYESADTVLGAELCQDFTTVSLNESGQLDSPNASSLSTLSLIQYRTLMSHKL